MITPALQLESPLDLCLDLGAERRRDVPAEMEQDAVQEIFLRVLNEMRLFQPEMPFAHWLSAVAPKTCAKLQRHRLRERGMGARPLFAPK